MPQPSAYDVVVLGGGPAGCATALALRRLGVAAILVVEAGHYAVERIGEGIPPDTRLLLQRLGIWEDFLNESHDPCLESCSSWGTDELVYNDFLFNPLGNGWHLDRQPSCVPCPNVCPGRDRWRSMAGRGRRSLCVRPNISSGNLQVTWGRIGSSGEHCWFFAGDASRLEAYQSNLSARFEAYLNARNYFYGLERRWTSSPFWERRQTRTAPDAVLAER